ncbi:MAG: vitamin K epoxide reductase family protein [archaeon]
MAKNSRVEKLLLALILIEVVLTGILAYQDVVGSAGSFCVAGSEEAGCSGVRDSVYGELFGMKLSFFGLISFLVLLVVFVYEKRIWEGSFFVLSLVGAVFAAYFLYLQVFVLKQMCSTCAVVDGTAILIFLLALASGKRRR